MCRDRGSITIWAAALAGCAARLLRGRRCGPAPSRDGGGPGGCWPLPFTFPTVRPARVPWRWDRGRHGGNLRGCEVVGDEVEVVVSRRVSLGQARRVHHRGQGTSRSGGARSLGDRRRGGALARRPPRQRRSDVRGPGSVGVASRRGRSGRRRCVVAGSSTRASLEPEPTGTGCWTRVRSSDGRSGRRCSATRSSRRGSSPRDPSARAARGGVHPLCKLLVLPL